MFEWGFIVLLVLLYVGYSIYYRYRKHLLRRKVQSFEKSLVDLKNTVDEAIQSCKHSKPPEPEQGGQSLWTATVDPSRSPLTFLTRIEVPRDFIGPMEAQIRREMEKREND